MSTPSLDRFVDDAQRAVDAQPAADLANYRDPRADRVWSNYLTAGLWGVMVLMAALHLNDIRIAMFGPPRAETDAQLRAVLTASRDAVVAWRQRHGALPTRVPVPALDALVSLTGAGDSFELKAALNGQAARMGEDGRLVPFTP